MMAAGRLAGRRPAPSWRGFRKLVTHRYAAPAPKSPATTQSTTLVRKQGEQLARGDRDRHMHGEGCRDSGPDPGGPVPGSQHKRGKHRLVRQLGKEGHRERDADHRKLEA